MTTPYAATARADRFAQVERLLDAGLHPDEIALRVGISPTAARRIAAPHRAEGHPKGKGTG